MKGEIDLKQSNIGFQGNLYNSSNPTRRWLHLRRRNWLMTKIHDLAPHDGCFFEAGIGCGVYTTFLDQIGHVNAIDINPEFVLNANLLGNVDASVADIQSIVVDPVHDIAICSEVIEHIEDSEQAIRNLFRSLKPGGYLILTTPNKYSTVELVARLLTNKTVVALAQRVYGEPIDDLEHINRLTQRELRRQITKSGFEIVSSDNIAFYLPVIGEYGGYVGLTICKQFEKLCNYIPGLSWLLWTQCWVLRKPENV